MKKTKTWIITYIYLFLILFFPVGRPAICGQSDPVTDDKNNISQLIGNVPSDYIIEYKNVKRMESLDSNCWLFQKIRQVSESLTNLDSKFSGSSTNYKIIQNLQLIFKGIRKCISHYNEYPSEQCFYKENITAQRFFIHVAEIIEEVQKQNMTNTICHPYTCQLSTTNPAQIGPTTVEDKKTTSRRPINTGYTYPRSTTRPIKKESTNQIDISRCLSGKDHQEGPVTFNMENPLLIPLVCISLAAVLVIGVITICKFRSRERHPVNKTVHNTGGTDQEGQSMMLKNTDGAHV
ncbi:kit ligand [Protopterus annectens]|uniref:kit ligand n=1 Tax=Protopterus annectens TaxID=7888 RepID=UPI001CFA99E9|nr:kit ligand [Protopterus annectens]